MCGINLLIGLDNLSERIQQMMLSTAHRGPDHSAYDVHDNRVAFAANRLKILDLSDSSNQPFWSENSMQALIWNGALYNYQDLRNRLLEAGFVFKTNSDTEVLLYWLTYKGLDGLGDCKGMFALAFLDLHAERVIILRDISGEKPLYYWKGKDQWIFSSEQRGVLASLPDPAKIDSRQIDSYFSLRHTLPNQGLFERVMQVLPGQGFVIDFDGKLTQSIALPSLPFQGKRNQNTFEELLKDAVLHNFHTQRSVGMVMSGGVDSSLVYTLWYEETMQPMPTFTATFEPQYQGKYRDPVYVDKLQKAYPSLHEPVLITLRMVQESWDQYIEQLDIPVGDSASLLTWMIAKQAKDNVQVLLSGAGADELFGGYNRHSAYAKYLNHPKFYQSFRWIQRLPLIDGLRSAHKFLSSLDQDLSLTFIRMAALQSPSIELEQALMAYYPEGLSPYKAALEWDRSVYLVNDILKIHDNACMAHGIEGRAPFLSQELISLSQAMTEDEHLALQGKMWLKESLTKRGLGIIANRKKLGFGLPLEEWLQEKSFRTWVFTEIKRLGPLGEVFFSEDMRRFVKEPERAGGQQFLLIWNIFLLLSWLEKHG